MEFALALQVMIAEGEHMEAELDELAHEAELGVEDYFSEGGVLPEG